MIRRWLLVSLPFLALVLSACPAGDDPPPDALLQSGGPDGRMAGGMACLGDASSCLTFQNDIECRGQDGCEVIQAAECGGVPRSCSSLFDSFSCIRQSGCVWSSSSRTCTGSPRSCSSMPGPGSCFGHIGCSW